MTTGQKQDTISKNSCEAKLTCEIWEARQEIQFCRQPARGIEDFLYALNLKDKIEAYERGELK